MESHKCGILAKAQKRRNLMRFRIDFRADPEAKKNLIHHFEPLRGITIISTHDGAHIDVGEDRQYAALLIDIYTASTWPGVRTTQITLENKE